MFKSLIQLARKFHFSKPKEVFTPPPYDVSSQLKGTVHCENMYFKLDRIKKAKTWSLVLYDASGNRLHSRRYKKTNFEAFPDRVNLELAGGENGLTLKWINDRKENYSELIYKIFAGRTEVGSWIWKETTLHNGDSITMHVNLNSILSFNS